WVDGWRLACEIGIVGGKWNWVSIDDAATRNASDDIENSRVVLKAAHAVSLKTEVGLRDELVGTTDLCHTRDRDQHDGGKPQCTTEPSNRRLERGKIHRTLTVRSDGRQQSDRREVGRHGRSAEAQ